MTEDTKTDIAEEDGWEGILGITEHHRSNDDDQDETAGTRPRGPIQLFKAREPDIADHQERDD